MSSGATRKPVTLVGDHLAQPATLERDHRSPAGLRLGGGHAEGLVPFCRAQNDSRTGHSLPESRPRHSPVNRHTWRVTSRVDLLAGVLRIVGVAIQVDRDACRLRDLDGFGGSLLRTQPAGEDGAIARPHRTRRWHGSAHRAAGSRLPGRPGSRRAPGTPIPPATAGGAACRAASRRAAAMAVSGGRWSVCTTGVPSPLARPMAGASNA